MAFVHKCPKCGLELTGDSVSTCPMCGIPIALSTGRNIWIGAAIQLTISTTCMLLFGFPKIMIAIFGAVILIGTALSAHMKATRSTPRVVAPQQLSHPVLWRVTSIAIALCALAIFSILLFGFVMFMDAWNRWHQYEGQPYHRSEFRVDRVYYQRRSKSSSFYASGTVDEHREWMSLQPYLHRMPRSQEEAEMSVPQGTSIPIYFFPDMKGRARVQMYEDTPPAESAHQRAIKILRDSLLLLAITGAALFILTRIRGWCVGEGSRGMQSRDAAVGS